MSTVPPELRLLALAARHGYPGGTRLTCTTVVRHLSLRGRGDGVAVGAHKERRTDGITSLDNNLVIVEIKSEGACRRSMLG